MYTSPFFVPPGEWVTVEGRFRCVSLTCMSSSCPRSPLGLSPSAHLADGTGDLILVWETNPLGFLKFLYRHTSTQDQVWAGSHFLNKASLRVCWVLLLFFFLVWPAICGGSPRKGRPLLSPLCQKEGRIWGDRRVERRVRWRRRRLYRRCEQEWITAAPDRSRRRARNGKRAENS